MAAGTVLAIVLASAAAGPGRAGPPVKPPGAPLELPLDDDVVPAALDVIPSNDDLQRNYPPVALMLDLGGRAVVTCKTTVEGRLDDCRIDSETPAGLGFGAATLRATAYFKVTPARRDGKPTAATITIPLAWKTGSGGRAAPEPEPPLPPVSAASLALAREALATQDVKGRLLAHWRPWLDRQSAGLVEVDDAQSGQRVLDAFRQGLTQTIDAQTERSAHLLAAHSPEADLRATLAFLQSPAGKAWTTAQAQLDEGERSPDFAKRVTAASRAHLCPTVACDTAGAQAGQRAAR